jgi:hypothetical protein
MRTTFRRILAATIALPLLALSLTACDTGDSAVRGDEEQTNTQLERYQANQPVPMFDWSQYRQTVIDIESAQANGVATTTFFFNQGVPAPIKTCPSIGFPVPTTAQITNPDQVYGSDAGSGAGRVTVSQMEPTGVYTGDSSGTYVVCVADDGTDYVTYWEGFIQTEGGPAHWDADASLIVLDGAATAAVTGNDTN